MTTKAKDFDCVEMMHRGGMRIHETLKGKSKAEVLAYWRQRHSELLEDLKKSRESRTSGE